MCETSRSGRRALLGLNRMGRRVTPKEEFRRAIQGGSDECKTIVGRFHDRLAEIESVLFRVFNRTPEMVRGDGTPHVESASLDRFDACFRTHVLQYLL